MITYGVVGAGGLGKGQIDYAMRSVLNQIDGITESDVRLVFVDASPPSQEVHGYPVLSVEDFLSENRGDHYFNLLFSGTKERQRTAELMIENGVKPLPHIHPNTELRNHTDVGEGLVMGYCSVIDTACTIGRFLQFLDHGYISHDCVIGDFVELAPRVGINGNTILEDHVYVGTGAIFRQGTPDQPLVIGRGAVVGMGSVVTKDVPAGATVIGNPARQV